MENPIERYLNHNFGSKSKPDDRQKEPFQLAFQISARDFFTGTLTRK